GGTLLVTEVGEPAAKSKDLARLLDLQARPPAAREWQAASPLQIQRLTALGDGDQGTMAATGIVPGGGGAIPANPGAAEEAAALELANKSVWPISTETFSHVNLMAGRVYAFPGNPF